MLRMAYLFLLILSAMGIDTAMLNSVSAAEDRLLSGVRQLTFEGRRAGEGYFNADGTKMIFQSERDEKNPFYQIFLMDLETGDVQQVSPGHGRTTCAWVHPSDKRVLYSSTHDDPDAHRKMATELRERASGTKKRYSWNFDSSYEIYTQDLTGTQRVNLTKAQGYDAEGSYSPDGNWIVFASNRRAYTADMSPAEAKLFAHDPASMMDIYLMRADGSNVERLTTAPGYDGGPFFSADGRRITWRRFSENGASAELYTMDLSTREEKRITNMGHMSWAPYFHPSGDYLIFASNQQGFANFELFIVDAAGGKDPVRVTFTDGFDGLPVFSPDGKKLSWTTKRTTNKTSQIFMANWNDGKARALLGLDALSGSETPKAKTNQLEGMTAAIRSQDARLHVERLASSDMAGRLTGTAGELRATAYVRDVFEQLGLKPGGEDGRWFQQFSFTSGAILGPDNSLAIAGLDGEPVLNRDWRPLAFSRIGAVTSSEVVFAGYGMTAPGTDKLPAYDSFGDLDVTGKWVMVFRFQPDDVSPELRRHWLHYSDLSYKAAVAKQRGAKGLIVVSGPQAGTSGQLMELKLDNTTAGTSLAGISVSDGLANRMLKATGKSLIDLHAGLSKGQSEKGFVLKNISVAASLDIQRQSRQGRNVLARLEAKAPTGEPPIIIGAHVDHLGQGEVSGSLARSDEKGAIHHGADDNASGVAGLLEIAQYLTDQHRRGKLSLKRDIVFAAWSGEELGTLGSSFFVEALAGSAVLKDKVAAYLNMDMIGHLREKVYLQGTGSSTIWAREIERRNVPVGLPISTQSDPYLPTDTTPFYMKGVPVLNAFTGAHEDYSTPRDTADKLNYDGLRDVARLMAGIARSLARQVEEPDYQEVARKKGGLARKHLRAYLGTIPAYGQDDSIKGVKLQGAVKGAPAEEAGIQNGDVLIGLTGVKIETIHDFMNALGGLKAGEATEMTVKRDGRTLNLTVVPAARD